MVSSALPKVVSSAYALTMHSNMKEISAFGKFLESQASDRGRISTAQTFVYPGGLFTYAHNRVLVAEVLVGIAM